MNECNEDFSKLSPEEIEKRKPRSYLSYFRDAFYLDNLRRMHHLEKLFPPKEQEKSNAEHAAKVLKNDNF